MTSPTISEEEKLKKPWKYEGYPGFSKRMASSDDFFLCRRFGELNARAILLMQDRIARKEEELHRMDCDAQKGPDDPGDSSSLRFEPRMEREKLLDELIPMLQQYSKAPISPPNSSKELFLTRVCKTNTSYPIPKSEPGVPPKNTKSPT